MFWSMPALNAGPQPSLALHMEPWDFGRLGKKGGSRGQPRRVLVVIANIPELIGGAGPCM